VTSSPLSCTQVSASPLLGIGSGSSRVPARPPSYFARVCSRPGNTAGFNGTSFGGIGTSNRCRVSATDRGRIVLRVGPTTDWTSRAFPAADVGHLMMVALAAVAIVAVRPPRNRFPAAGWALVVNAIRQDDLVAPVEGRLHWARSSAARTPRLLSALLAPPSGVTPHSIVAAAIAAVAQFLE
jgi:hypothetical protein